MILMVSVQGLVEAIEARVNVEQVVRSPTDLQAGCRGECLQVVVVEHQAAEPTAVLAT